MHVNVLCINWRLMMVFAIVQHVKDMHLPEYALAVVNVNTLLLHNHSVIPLHRLSYLNDCYYYYSLRRISQCFCVKCVSGCFFCPVSSCFFSFFFFCFFHFYLKSGRKRKLAWVETKMLFLLGKMTQIVFLRSPSSSNWRAKNLFLSIHRLKALNLFPPEIEAFSLINEYLNCFCQSNFESLHYLVLFAY